MHIGRAMLSLGNDRQHYPRLLRFRQATLANIKRHRPGDIGHGLPVSVVACADFSADVGRGLLAWAMACAIAHSFSSVDFPHLPWPEYNVQPTWGVACLHRLLPTHNGQTTSGKAFPHRLCSTHNGQPTLNMVCPHRLWHAQNGQSTSYVGCQYCPHLAHIGMMTSIVS